jgi:hypothetical protein
MGRATRERKPGEKSCRRGEESGREHREKIWGEETGRKPRERNPGGMQCNSSCENTELEYKIL